MTPLKRSFSALALLLAVPLAASTAHAGQAKKQTATPSKPAQVKVDSPNMARSISDWHTELGKTPQRAASAPSGSTVKRTAANAQPASQRGNQGKGSEKPSERAREIPLRSIRQ